VLLLADAGCTTGFGVVSQQIGDRLVTQYGHDIHVLAVNYKGDHWKTAMKLYVPTMRNPTDIYGKGRMTEMMSKVLPDVTMMINDPYVILRLLFRNDFDEDLGVARRWNVLPDWLGHDPGPREDAPGMADHRDADPSGSVIDASGHEQARAHAVPQRSAGLSRDRHRGVPAAQRQGPGHLVAGCEGHLEARRQAAVRTAARLQADPPGRPEQPPQELHRHVREDPEIHVWFHCRTEGDDIELNQVVQRDMSIADRFHWPDRFSTFIGWGLDDLVALYNAADVFVSTSYGEGFGLTLVEAAACGLPIVAQNVSSIPEVVGPGGVLIDPERLIGVASGQDQWLPNVEAFTNAIRKLLDSRGARRSLGEAGRDHVKASFSWDEAALRFHELITGVVQKTSGSTPSGGLDANTQ
jgi:hypothetical protein